MEIWNFVDTSANPVKPVVPLGITVGSAFPSPDRLANRYYRLAVWPLLLPVCLLPAASPADADLQFDGVDDSAIADVYL